MNELIIKNLNTQITVPDRWIDKRNQLVTSATELVAVDSQPAFDDGSELLNSITKHSNALEKERKKLSAPFSKAAKAIKKMCDDERAELEKEKKRIKQLLSRYAAEQAQKKLEAQRQREEAERKEAERLFAKQQKAEEDLLGVVDPEPIKVEVEPAPYIEQAHSSSAKIIKRLIWLVDDEEAIPLAFQSIDPRKVNEYMRTQKERIMREIENGSDGKSFVAGINFEIKTDVQGRQLI